MDNLRAEPVRRSPWGRVHRRSPGINLAGLTGRYRDQEKSREYVNRIAGGAGEAGVEK